MGGEPAILLLKGGNVIFRLDALYLFVGMRFGARTKGGDSAR